MVDMDGWRWRMGEWWTRMEMEDGGMVDMDGDGGWVNGGHGWMEVEDGGMVDMDGCRVDRGWTQMEGG